ncbi:Crp/Fnr family transcriptional regulator [Kaarinaea lacus]
MEGSWITHPTDFISNMSLQDRQGLYHLGKVHYYRRGEMVFHMGSSSNEVYILLDGRVKVYELSEEGKEVILWFCFPGELFGLSEVFQCSGREVNAQACSQVEVLTIKKADFERYIKQHSHLAMHVIELLGYRLRELSDVLLDIASDDVTSRVIKLLTRLCSRYGKPEDKHILLDIALTHQEMADMIGTSRQTVTSVLSMLRKKGVLKMQQRSIYLQDLPWIERVAGKISYPRYSTPHVQIVRNTA